MENGATDLRSPPRRKRASSPSRRPPKFRAELKARGVGPISVGHVIVATWEPHEEDVLDTIRDFGLELQVIFNKGAVMVLPSGVNKATGLVAALAELGLSPHNAVGVGDAENDHAFLKVCECSAAVANALPAVKDTADIVMKKRPRRRRRRTDRRDDRQRPLGPQDARPAPHSDRRSGHWNSTVRHRAPSPASTGAASVKTRPIRSWKTASIRPDRECMVCGTSGSGKSTLTTAILERLADAGYQALVVDPEGDYTNLEFAHHVGNPKQAPRLEDVTDALRDPKRSVVVNLLGVPLADRPKFFAQLLPRILEVKARTGRPHWLVVDEAHHLLPGRPGRGRESRRNYPIAADVHHRSRGAVEPAALTNVGTLLVIGGHPAKTVAKFCAAVDVAKPACPVVEGDKLPTGDAMLVAARREGRGDHSHEAAADRAKAALAEVRRRATSARSGASTSAVPQGN